MRVTRPRRHGELNEWVDFDLYVGANDAGFVGYPDHLLTDTEKKRWRADLKAKERKRRPIGFQAVWDD